jgi:hypothetical protein
MIQLLWPIALIVGWLALLYFFGPRIKPPPMTNFMFYRRQALRRRVKSKDIPILCSFHSGYLREGELAVLDPTRCEACQKLRAKNVT